MVRDDRYTFVAALLRRSKNRTAANLDHYAKRSVYIIALPMAEFAQSRFRVTYRLVEEVDRVEEIKHNVVRMTLLDMKYDSPLNIAIISDLPGGTGLGSSSSFAAGFIFLMERLGGHAIAKLDLFKRAVYTEQVLLNENVGIPELVALACLLACLYRRSTTRLCNRAGATDENQREKERQRPFALFKLCHAGLELLEGNEPESMLREFGSLVSGVGIEVEAIGAIGVHHCRRVRRNLR